MLRKWKVLELYGLGSILELVSILLPILDGLTVEEQFRKQSIDRIQKRRLLCYGGAYVERETQKWVVFLNSNNSFDQNLFTLAHELAHTFAHEKRRWRLVNVWRTKSDQLEDFCDMFAAEWLLRNNNREQLATILTERRTEEIIYLNDRQSKVLIA